MAETTPRREQILAAFEGFRSELDEYGDRRERLIKLNRDITNLSKKVIFVLHRLANVESENGSIPPEALREGSAKMDEVKALFVQVSKELVGQPFMRFIRNFGDGLQEAIEALSLLHYIKHGTLIKYAEVQAFLSSPSGEILFPMPYTDYLLGVSDLTGEVMRFAIVAMSIKGGRKKAGEVCAFVRACQGDFEAFVPFVKDLGKKQLVTAQSLYKLEDAAYAVKIRELEYQGKEGVSIDEVVGRYVAVMGRPTDSSKRDGNDDY